MIDEVRNAKSVSGLPQGEDRTDGFCAAVGSRFQCFEPNAPVVDRITVTQDLPGLHDNMERDRVWPGETLLWEGPLHNLEGVQYV